MQFAVLLWCASHGVVITDNVWLYGDDHRMRILSVGDVVEIIEHNDRMMVRYDSAVGRLEKGVVFDLGDAHTEPLLFVCARGYYDEGDAGKAARLFHIFTEHYKNSVYLPEVLYYAGLSYEAAAKTAGECADIVFNKDSTARYYTGAAYQILLERFPESVYAPKAAYRLIHVFRTEHSPWHDSVQSIEEELTMWQDFVSRYSNSEEYVVALLEIGYLNRVLFEITGTQEYREDARRIFEKIAAEYPHTIYGAQSEVNLYEIEQGEHIYKY
jgi:hypothetical protein